MSHINYKYAMVNQTTVCVHWEFILFIQAMDVATQDTERAIDSSQVRFSKNKETEQTTNSKPLQTTTFVSLHSNEC